MAEGACRRTTNAFINHVSIALGSHAEFDTCVEIAFRLGFLSPDGHSESSEISGTTRRLLNGLIRSLEAKTTRR
jgi:four helix bundle protein